MFEIITIDPQLADLVEKELHSIRMVWEYAPLTTNYYNLDKTTSEERERIDTLTSKYGPVVDTQKFSETIYNDAFHRMPFIAMRQNPNSRYNKVFINTSKLINNIQEKHIPPTHKVSRIICNMQTIRPSWTMNAIHPDSRNKDNITVLYYVNTSDGDTFFFEGTECARRLSPVKGTAAIYPSITFHAGSTPTKTETRVVINMVFTPK